MTKSYGYDNAGNLTSNNGITYSYDARNELTSDGSGTYAYTAGGDLATATGPGGTATFASDAYGQQVTDAASSLSYDVLGRMVSDARQGGGGITLTYDGLTGQVASDSSASYSRDPAGQITGVSTTAGSRLLALSTQHDDLSGLFTATGTALAGSVTYDPWGQVLASAGPAVQVGYQGQWTDPGTGQVEMGARFYQPSAGGFINQDTYAGGEGGPAVTDNLHAYADDNPMSVMDPSGHAPSKSSGSGGGVTAGEIAAVAASVAAHSAAALARMLNSAAARAAQLRAQARQLAAAAFKAAQAQLQVAREWQDKANAAWAAARADLGKGQDLAGMEDPRVPQGRGGRDRDSPVRRGPRRRGVRRLRRAGSRRVHLADGGRSRGHRGAAGGAGGQGRGPGRRRGGQAGRRRGPDRARAGGRGGPRGGRRRV